MPELCRSFYKKMLFTVLILLLIGVCGTVQGYAGILQNVSNTAAGSEKAVAGENRCMKTRYASGKSTAEKEENPVEAVEETEEQDSEEAVEETEKTEAENSGKSVTGTGVQDSEEAVEETEKTEAENSGKSVTGTGVQDSEEAVEETEKTEAENSGKSATGTQGQESEEAAAGTKEMKEMEKQNSEEVSAENEETEEQSPEESVTNTEETEILSSEASSADETEPDWASYAPDMTDENGNFQLDLDYIDSYGKETCTDIIFFGDSRVVGMAYDSGKYNYVGKVGEGYSWMAGEGMQLLKGQMDSLPDADIVFCFGINDLDNIGSYISYYQQVLSWYPDRRFWFLSVNPVDEEAESVYGYSVANSSVEAFNAQLQAAFPDAYLDCYSYLMEMGFSTEDGVHYVAAVYAAVEDFTWREIQKCLDK